MNTNTPRPGLLLEAGPEPERLWNHGWLPSGQTTWSARWFGRDELRIYPFEGINPFWPRPIPTWPYMELPLLLSGVGWGGVGGFLWKSCSVGLINSTVHLAAVTGLKVIPNNLPPKLGCRQLCRLNAQWVSVCVCLCVCMYVAFQVSGQMCWYVCVSVFGGKCA